MHTMSERPNFFKLLLDREARGRTLALGLIAIGLYTLLWLPNRATAHEDAVDATDEVSAPAVDITLGLYLREVQESDPYDFWVRYSNIGAVTSTVDISTTIRGVLFGSIPHDSNCVVQPGLEISCHHQVVLPAHAEGPRTDYYDFYKVDGLEGERVVIRGIIIGNPDKVSGNTLTISGAAQDIYPVQPIPPTATLLPTPTATATAEPSATPTLVPNPDSTLFLPLVSR